MPSAFNVTAATNDVQLSASRQGGVALTISNISGKPQQGRVSIAALDSTKATWLSVAGGADRAFPVGGTQQVTIQIAVPNDAAPGHYTFRPDVVSVQNPDEDSTQGPTLAFEVPPPPPPDGGAKIPWWVFAAIAAVVVLVAAVVAYLLVLTKIVPDVVGSDVGAAQATLSSAGFQPGTPTPQADLSKAPGIVLSQDPPAGARAGRGSTVNLVVVAPSVLVPSVIGQQFATARLILSQAGLNPATAGFGCTTSTTIVRGQSPAPNTRVAPGTPATLTCLLIRPPVSITPPRVITTQP
jgi:hypothetical protein